MNFSSSPETHVLLVHTNVLCRILRPNASYVHSILRHEPEGVSGRLSTFINRFSASLKILIKQVGRVKAFTQVPAVAITATSCHLSITYVIKPILKLLPGHWRAVWLVFTASNHIAHLVVFEQSV